MVVNNHDHLPLLQSQEFLPSISPWLTLSGLTLVSVFVGAVGLMAVIKYPVTVQAPGTIRPKGELYVVQANVEGRVTQLLVQENQRVKPGEILATLDDSLLQTQKSHLQNQIQAAQLQLTQIQAQIKSLDDQKQTEVLRTQHSLVSAQAELRRHQRQYRDNRLNTTATVAEAQANLEIAQNNWQTAQLELTAAAANLRAIQAALKAARAKRDRYQSVATEGAFPQDQLEEAQLSLEQQQQAYAAQLAIVESHQKMQAARQQEAKAALARLQRAKVSLNPSSMEMAIASEHIAEERATGKITVATLTRDREDLLQKQIELQQQLKKDQRSRQQIERDLAQTTITATTAGVITHLRIRNPGQSIQKGETLAQIVPSQAPLVIKAQVSPQDISKVKQGQSVDMRVSACPSSDYGTLKGKVSQISQDTMNRPNESVSQGNVNLNEALSPNPFYEITIIPKTLTLKQGKFTCLIQLGMEGKVSILSKEETVLKFLLRKVKLMEPI